MAEPPAEVAHLRALDATPMGGNEPRIPMAEVAKHDSLDDGWVVVRGVVYDITAFAKTHPGFHGGGAGKVSTAIAIALALGGDATEEFGKFHRHAYMWKMLATFRIGVRDDAAAAPLRVELTDEQRSGIDDVHPVPSWLFKEVLDFEKVYRADVPAHLVEYIARYKASVRGAKEPEEDEERETRRGGGLVAGVVAAAACGAAALCWRGSRVRAT